QALVGVEVGDRPCLAERVVEPALGDAAVQRHLPALEAGTALRARARVLTLVAAAGGLAVARARALPLAVRTAHGAGGGLDLVQLHFFSPSGPATSSQTTRCSIFLHIPRVDGVSSRTTLRPGRVRPIPASTRPWLNLKPIALRTWRTRIHFL